jgi:hypothetical protein
MTLERLEFDSTLDEVVDVSVRLVENTAAYRRNRQQWQWTFGVCAAGGAAVMLLRGNDVPSYGALAIASFAALVAGTAAGMLYGRYHDRHVRRHYRRMLDELYGSAETIHWEFEIRPDTLWSRSQHAEVAFPWSRLRQVKDVSGAIELWFDPGLAIVRDRAFSGQADRRAFLEAVSRYLPNDGAGSRVR